MPEHEFDLTRSERGLIRSRCLVEGGKEFMVRRDQKRVHCPRCRSEVELPTHLFEMVPKEEGG